MALSTVKAEYVAACLASRQAIWLQKLLSGLFGLVLEMTCIWCNNQSCMKFSENPLFHDKSKYIEIRYYNIRDMAQMGETRFQFVTTKDQVVDVFTKPLSRTKFEYFKHKLGMVPLKGVVGGTHPA